MAKVTSSSSVGRPRFRPVSTTYLTAKGVKVARTVTNVNQAEVASTFVELAQSLDTRYGCLFESDYEYPGRYARWGMGFKNPPVKIEGYNTTRKVVITALNKRGEMLLPLFDRILRSCPAVEMTSGSADETATKKAKTEQMFLEAKVKEVNSVFSEEERSRQHSMFSVVRSIVAWFTVEPAVDPQLGLYGAFGYDLTFQFDKIKLHQQRKDSDRDLLLFLPDEIIVHDIQLAKCWKLAYDFEYEEPGAEGPASITKTTQGLQRDGPILPFQFFTGKVDEVATRDHQPGEYAKSVDMARKEFKVGNLFEVVLSQIFSQTLVDQKVTPSELFRRIKIRNPSPYMFIINLGENEHLVGASPEMFVRAQKLKKTKEDVNNELDDEYDIKIETCPISGTIKRGDHALEDAERIKEILSNKKEESELTMCTDVDRNDKSRICKEGTVEVVGRRQIEKYSRLIHTVDHVVGILRTGFDALDAFLVHTWAVTVSGAPKTWAIQFIENHERSPRKWYGGAVGLIGFDGTLNTGMTLRTINIKDGVAHVRAGATLLYDSDPMSEEKETELKASAFRDILKPEFLLATKKQDRNGTANGTAGSVLTPTFVVLVVDHEDSFVNTLSSYIRELKATVKTMRHSSVSREVLKEINPNLVLLSPGPGCPTDFKISSLIDLLLELKIPIFGVCLGLQGIVEYYGGKLKTLGYPMHGKPAQLYQKDATDAQKTIFRGLPSVFSVGRYHSLHADSKTFPEDLQVIATTTLKGNLIPGTDTSEGDVEGEIIMAIQHRSLPIAAVQFHPESIMTSPKIGLQLLRNAMESLRY